MIVLAVHLLTATAAQPRCLRDIELQMQKVSTYRDKLLYISATMKSLDTRSRQLKDKASQLHTARVNYDAQAASARQRNQEHDMAVAAKVVVPSNALAPSISIAPSPTIPANESPRSSSPIAESSLPSTVATTPQTEDLSQPDIAYVSSQTQVKKKKKARPKKREAIIDEGPIKRPTSSPDQSRTLRPPQ
jgi:hypothetical protein